MRTIMNTISKVLNKIIISLLVFTCPGCSFGNNIHNETTVRKGIRMESKQVEIKLIISVFENSVIATLSFYNISHQDIYLEKVNACLIGRVENDVFYITSAGNQISYLGPFSKAAPPGPNDVVKLSIGETISTSIDLCKAYDIHKSGKDYRVTYSAYHSSPDTITPITLLKAVSNDAGFRF